MKVVGLFAVAVDVRPGSVRCVVAVIEAGGIGRNRTRRQQRQLHIVACGQRQPVIGLGVDDGAHLRSLRLQHWSLAAHFNGLANPTHLHLHIDAGSLVEYQREGLMSAGLEAGAETFN